MKRSLGVQASRRLILNEERSTLSLPRRSSRRDQLHSFGVSLVVHVFLLLIAATWVLSDDRAADELFVFLERADSDTDAAESLVDAPIEFADLIEDRPPTLMEQTASPPLEEISLKGIPLPPLREAEPIPEKPAPRPADIQPDKQPGPSEGVDETAEEEVRKRLERAGAKTGAIQISLIWNNGNDLDLYVETPVHDIIAFNYKRSRCGGELDVDMNAKKVQSLEPVENVFWSAAKAPHGIFVVGVHEYQNHGFRDPTRFLVSLKVDDKVHHFRGAVRAGKNVTAVCKFKRTAGGIVFLETPEVFGGNRSGKPVFK